MAALWNTRIALLTGLVVTLLGAFYIYQSPLPLNFSIPRPTTSNSVPGLKMSLSQTSLKGPTILVTLENNHPDTTYTILKWDTPLDASALNTGVFSIVDQTSNEEVGQIILHVNRKMPPPPNQLVTLAPGTQEKVEVVFDKAWMPKRRSTYKISAKGMFKGVWAKPGDKVTRKELYGYAESPFAGRRFVTNEVVLEVR
ncbi:hypothetical protein DDE82_008013 [Stemphylium lycopersici]|uniref:Uncharacterized protein n=1 Tax=Stemphylium lycopersici TaxID=183478 RepID=A0A364MTL7_STELY|nr:hypothetical protein TW65_07441 [Stemphylium lycopersici]RAQ99652.1 hypothetical protein DDE82_008013 [Stemphylium lycopersici]RAR02679.1 hypothetical protein DDE83_008495 [Stemphylium lycopersici]